jgi:hypothetical protein
MLHRVVVGDVAEFSKVSAAYIYKQLTKLHTFDPEDGGSLYLRNVCNIAHTTWCNNPRTNIHSNVKHPLVSIVLSI